jgi:hypothetical protein
VERDGKNLWNKDRPDAENGYYFLTGEFHADNNYRCLAFPCTQNDKFTKSGSGWGGIVTFWNEETFVSGVNRTSVTIPSGANIVKFSCQYSSTDAQLELGSTATDYEPYTGSTIPVNWQTEAGTVYGGTLTVNEDGSGSVEVTRVAETISEMNFSYQSQYPRFYTSKVKNIAKLPPLSQVNLICEVLTCVSDSTSPKPSDSLSFASSGNLFINNTTYASKDAMISAIGNKLISYELAEPITYQLTAQQISSLLGQNNIWSDAGSVTVEYQSN